MNKNLFSTTPGKLLPNTDATNHEGGKAYAFTAKHALAQYAATGCMSRTFYASAEAQLADVVLLCDQVEASFVAKTAVYVSRSVIPTRRATQYLQPRRWRIQHRAGEDPREGGCAGHRSRVARGRRR